MGKNGGVRQGAGRPKGSGHKIKSTLEREAVMKAMRKRVMGMADQLLDAQASLARGVSFLYVVKTLQEGKKAVKQKPEIVTNPDTISSYLNGELDGLPNEYYYITAKEPSNLAIDSLLNRTFGKPVESVEVSGKDGDKLGVMMFMPTPHASDE